MNSPDPIIVRAKILPDHQYWMHAPFRRNFGFDRIVGALDHFVLQCSQQTIRSNITQEAHWTIPASFSDCEIYVYGTPETTFQFLEAN